MLYKQILTDVWGKAVRMHQTNINVIQRLQNTVLGNTVKVHPNLWPPHGLGTEMVTDICN